MVVHKINENIWLVRKKDARAKIAPKQYSATYDFVIFVEPVYQDESFWRIQIRYDDLSFMGKKVTLEDRINFIKDGNMPMSGNALPIMVPIADARKIAASIANSDLATS